MDLEREHTTTAVPAATTTAAERKRESRKRIRDQLGDAQFKRREAMKRKERRVRQQDHIREAIAEAAGATADDIGSNRATVGDDNAANDDTNGDSDDDDGANDHSVRKNIEKLIIREVLKAVRQFWFDAKGQMTRQHIPTLVQTLNDVQDRVRQKISGEISKAELAEVLYKYSKEFDQGKHRIVKKTARGYVDRLFYIHRRLHKLKTNADEIDLKFLTRTDEVIPLVMSLTSSAGKTKGQELEKSSKISYLGALVALTSRTSGLETAYKTYSDIYNRLAAEYKADRDDNKITANEKDRLLPWDTIVGGLSKVSSPDDKALYAVYTLQPPRRIIDFSRMKVTNRPVDALDLRFNWLLIDRNGTPVEFIYNRYKTAKDYHTQKFPIESAELAGILRSYIPYKGLHAGDMLFSNQSGMRYRANAFSGMLGTMFKKYLGVRISVNLLRHSCIIAFLNERQRTVAEKKQLATKMGHSIHMQGLYHRIEQGEHVDLKTIEEEDAEDLYNDDNDDDDVPLETIMANMKKKKTKK